MRQLSARALILPLLFLAALLCLPPRAVRAQSSADDAFKELDREAGEEVGAEKPAAPPARHEPPAAAPKRELPQRPAPAPAPAPSRVAPPPAPPAAPPAAAALAGLTLKLPPSRPPAPIQLKEGLDIRNLTQSDYRDVVLAAREAMRLVYGKMTPEQDQKFEAKWTPPLAYPSGELVEYFNKLNPLLNEFLSLRESIYRASQEFEAAWTESLVTAGYGLSGGASEALGVAEQQKEVLQGLNARLAQVTQAITALGDPPDAEAAHRRRKKGHDGSVAVMRKLIPRGAGADDEKKDEPAVDPGVWVFDHVQEYPHATKASVSWQRGGRKVDAKVGPTSLRMTVDTSWYTSQGQKEAHWAADLEWTEAPKTIKWNGTFEVGCRAHITRTGIPPGPYDGRWNAENWPMEAHVYIGNGPGVGTWIGEQKCACGEYSGVITPDCTVTLPVRDKEFLSQRREVDPKVRLEEHLRSNTVLSFGVDAHMYYDWAEVERRYFYRFERGKTQEEAETEDRRFESDEAAAKREAINFHRMNIQIIQENIAREQAELAAHPERADALEFRLRNLRSNMQAEADLVASIETGQYVHTRTEADDYISRQFVANIYADQQRMVEAQHQLAELQRLAGFLPEGEAQKAREMIAKQINAGDVVRGDLSKAGPLREALLNKVVGYVEGAKAQQEIASADRAIRYLELAKNAGNMAAMVVVGNVGAAIYAGATSFYTDGAVEGIKAAASWYSQAGYCAVEAFEGFQKGGMFTKGGAEGAAERGGTAVALNLFIEYGLPKIGGLFRGVEGAAAQAVRNVEQGALTEAEKVTMKQFEESLAKGKKLASEVRQAETQLIQAKAGNYPAEAIKELEQKAGAKAAEVNANYAAKSFLKSGGDNLAAQAQERLMGKIYEKAHTKALAKLYKQGYNVEQLTFQEFRNASSKGSFGMDHDWGLLSKPGGGWLTKDGKAVSELALQKDGSAALEEAYREVTNGHSAEASFVEFTTKAHPESFVDLNVLKNLKDPENIAKLNAVWGEQTARTIEYKGLKMLNSKDLQSFQGFQEASRGLAKELDKKVIPLISAAQGGKGLSPEGLKRTAAQFEELKAVLSAFGESKIDPVTAGRRIREITGGKDLPEVLEQVRSVTEAVYKMGNLGPRPPVLDIRVLGLLKTDKDAKH